jgi:competence protein ComEA
LATKDELMKLPGVGTVTADNIIAYRESNGMFQKIENITNISGIGTKTFERLKDLITI